MVALDGETYITSGTLSGDTITGGITVKIDTESFKYNLDKELLEIPIPTTVASEEAMRLIYDFKKIKESVTIKGWLIDEDGGDSADTKFDNLRILSGTGTSGPEDGLITIVYGLSSDSTQRTYEGSINKIEVDETYLYKDKKPITIQITMGESEL
jgi:hypothetical protein